MIPFRIVSDTFEPAMTISFDHMAVLIFAHDGSNKDILKNQ